MLAVVLSTSAINHVHAWTPGTGNESATSGFSVDRQSRNDVVSFWHAVYKQSEGYENRIDWTGLSNGPGTTSAEFKGDVQRRINYFRAMAGMNADLAMTATSTVLLTAETPAVARPSASTTKMTAAQYAAYMITINSDEYRPGGGVINGTASPHNPPSSWSWDSPTARNGAFYSNLVSGFYGPGAIDAYMHENDQGAAGGTNQEVAHRRLILYSRRTEFATGDVTMTPSGNAPYYAANALYASGNILPYTSFQFVAWPSAGFFPEPITTKYWSLSYSGADFSLAAVTMTNASGGSVSTNIVSRAANFGDRTLVWEPVAGEIGSAATADQTFDVTVSNIVINGVSQSFSYSVTLINPDRLLELPTLIGSESPPDTGAQYFFDPIDQAEGYQLQVSKEIDGTWKEGAESATASLVIDGTASTYPLSRLEARRSGSVGFHIGLTTANYQSQFVELDRQLVPASDSELIFYHRKRRMGSDTRAMAQISTDGGTTWIELWGIQGDGNYVNGFTQEHVSLATYAGQGIRVRFSVERPLTATAGYWPADQSAGDQHGIHIDDIEISGGDLELADIVETDYPSGVTQVTLDAVTAGLVGSLLDINRGYRIGLRAKLGTHWFSYGSALNVTPVSVSSISHYEAWMRGEYYVIGAFHADYDHDGISNGIEHVFGLDPTDKSDAVAALNPTIVDGHIQLSHGIIGGASVAAELSYTLQAGSWEDVAVTISGNVATVSVPLGVPACYLRWKLDSQP